MTKKEEQVMGLLMVLMLLTGGVAGVAIGRIWMKANTVEAGVGIYKSVGNWGRTEYQLLTKEFIIFDHEFEKGEQKQKLLEDFKIISIKKIGEKYQAVLEKVE